MLDSVIRVNKKYYPQTLFEEWKYEIKILSMNGDFDLSLFDNEMDCDSDNESDNDTNNESDNDESVKTVF